MKAARWLLLALAVFSVSACTPDEDVYFQNNTSQRLYLMPRELPKSGKFARHAIPPDQMSYLQLVSKGSCTTSWLIYDEREVVVKDPGRMCWHDTVTIP